MACEEKSTLPDVKAVSVYTMCKVNEQELSFKVKNYRVYQSETSRTIISEFSKTEEYSEANIIVILLYFWM